MRSPISTERLVLERAEEVTQVIEDAPWLLDVLRVLPKGVDQMSPSMPGLVGDQLHAEDGSGVLTDFIQRTGQKDRRSAGC